MPPCGGSVARQQLDAYEARMALAVVEGQMWQSGQIRLASLGEAVTEKSKRRLLVKPNGSSAQKQ